MITITDKAQETLKQTLDENPQKVLRIFIQGYG